MIHRFIHPTEKDEDKIIESMASEIIRSSNLEENNMGFSKEKVKSLLVTVFISVILAGIGYVLMVGDLWKIDMHALINAAVLAGFSTVITSIKLLGTNEDTGKIAGIKVRK